MKILLQNQIIDLSLVYKVSSIDVYDWDYKNNYRDRSVKCYIRLSFLNKTAEDFSWEKPMCKNEKEYTEFINYVNSEYSKLISLWSNSKPLDLPSVGSKFISIIDKECDGGKW